MSKRLQAKEEAKATEKANRKFEWKWAEDGGVIHGDCGTKPSEKIMAFDMDGTLIRPKSKAKFAKDANDWEILYDKVIPKLKEYHDKGFKIVIMTNQGGIEKGHTKLSDIKTKIENITELFGIPIQVLISPNKDYYHKPSPGMWVYMSKNLNGGKTIDLGQSYYVGDAAGRPKNGPRAADFDNTDYKFALNVGCLFMTPESCFLGEKDLLPEIDFNPKKVFKTNGTVFKGKSNPKIRGDGKEMIIFVGSPGSGKSTFWKNHLSDYVRVNNDTLKSKEKCIKVAREALQAGKSVVIDNTNPKAETRKIYIDLAKEYKYPVRCFFFDVPKEVAFHLDDQREMNIHRKHESGRVGKMPIHTFYKYLEKPSKDEGISEIETIEFIAGPFQNKEDEMMFYSHVSSKH